jgi:hypothetical protein
MHCYVAGACMIEWYQDQVVRMQVQYCSFKARAKQMKNKFLLTDPFYIQLIVIYYKSLPNNMF